MSIPTSLLAETAITEAHSVCEQLKLSFGKPGPKAGFPNSSRRKFQASGATLPPTVSVRARRSAARVERERLRMSRSRIAANSAVSCGVTVAQWRVPSVEAQCGTYHIRTPGEISRPDRVLAPSARSVRQNRLSPPNAKIGATLARNSKLITGPALLAQTRRLFCKDQPINGPVTNDRSNCSY